jgi:hypothetical protein
MAVSDLVMAGMFDVASLMSAKWPYLAGTSGV